MSFNLFMLHDPSPLTNVNNADDAIPMPNDWAEWSGALLIHPSRIPVMVLVSFRGHDEAFLESKLYAMRRLELPFVILDPKDECRLKRAENSWRVHCSGT